MTNAEMHSVQVQDTPVLLEGALAPGFKLVGEHLVEATDGTADFGRPPARFGPLLPPSGCLSLPRTSASSGSRDMRFIAAVTLKHPRVEVAFPASGHTSHARAHPKR